MYKKKGGGQNREVWRIIETKNKKQQNENLKGSKFAEAKKGK